MSCHCQHEHECKFGKRGRLFQICNGTALVNGEPISEDLRQKYKDSWTFAPSQHQSGVGTELSRIFSWFWFQADAGCNCKHYANEMNKNGIEWCKNNLPTIMGWVKEGAAKQGIDFGKIQETGAKMAILLAIKRATEAEKKEARFSQEDLDRAEKMIDTPGSKPDNWNQWPHIQEAMKRRLKRLKNERHDYPGCGTGRGIVTLGGSSRYFGCAWVLVNMLRHLGCTLPIEWWYTDEYEMDGEMERLARSLPGVTVRATGTMGGWQAKSHAIMNSAFQEVLFLDSDIVPTRDPSYLFDSPEFVQYGSVLWPDLPNKLGCDITKEAFEICGLPVPGSSRLPHHNKPSDYRPVESGQILLDKARCWHALNICRDMNDNAEFWYPEPRGKRHWHIYGDKSTFYLAWELTNTPYVMPVECGWTGDNKAGAFLQKDFSGEVVFQHRCQPQSKWSLHGENKEAPKFLYHKECQGFLDELKSKWIGHPYDGGNSIDFGHWFYSHRGGPMTRVHLKETGEIDKDLHWAWVAERIVIADSNKARDILGRDDRCSWVNHGTKSYLMPAPPPDIQINPGFAEARLWSEVVVENEYKLSLYGSEEVIIDIGAHCGFFSIAASNRGAGKVLAFEPNPRNFAMLAQDRKSTRLNSSH